MKVAAVQMNCVLGDGETNLQTVRGFAVRAKDQGVELLVLPEMVDTGYSMTVIHEHAGTWGAGFVPELQSLAQELSVAIVSR